MIDTAAYLERIGYDGVISPTVATLRALHLAHLRAVPFENLDIHLHRPIVLEETSLFDKIVRRRRGGFCYELNGLFAALLRDLGFEVTLLAAQYPREGGQIAPETDHLVLFIGTADAVAPWLADVGAGRDSFAVPLRTTTAAKQPQPAADASFRLAAEEDGFRLLRQERGGGWERRYRFTLHSRTLADFDAGSHYHQTSPESHFTQQRVCTLLTPSGRITLSDRRLITTAAGKRTEQTLPDEAAYLAALRSHFGIDLER
jgi:N-hydroxyarylamine O-acetyltransferase